MYLFLNGWIDVVCRYRVPKWQWQFELPPLPSGLPILVKKRFTVAQFRYRQKTTVFAPTTLSPPFGLFRILLPAESIRHLAHICSHWLTGKLIFYGLLSADCWLKVYIQTDFSSFTSFIAATRHTLLEMQTYWQTEHTVSSHSSYIFGVVQMLAPASIINGTHIKVKEEETIQQFDESVANCR